MSRKKVEEPSAGAPEWMTTYSDLVTLLMCFFVLLFASSTIDASKFQAIANSFSSSPIDLKLQSSSAPAINDLLGAGIMHMSRESGPQDGKGNVEAYEKAQEELNKIASELSSYFAENNLQDRITVKLNEDSVELDFNEAILFDRGRAVLKPEAVDILDIISSQLMEYPDNDIDVVGHTDTDPINTPQYPNNWFLSSARAIAVGSYFIDNKGVEPKRFILLGRGEYLPVAPNDTQENKAKNRRVELKIKSSYYSSRQ